MGGGGFSGTGLRLESSKLLKTTREGGGRGMNFEV